MKSSKSSHGYGKVADDLEDHPSLPKSPNHKPLTLALLSIFFLLLLLSLLLCLTLRPTSRASSTISIVCNVTRFPSSCFSSISSLQNPNDPQSILTLSLHISQFHLSNLSSSLSSTSNSLALADCKAQISDALTRLNDSLSAIDYDNAFLTDAKIHDMQTWISSALTDLETCLDGLQETDSPLLPDMKLKMQRSREYVSNSLAIVANIRVLMRRFNRSLH